MLRLPHTDLNRARLLRWAVMVVVSISVGWLGKQSYAVHKLTRGVGDTWFHDASGKPWFRLDEQRHDVPIAAISPHLQHAFVAVEDHRFFLHPGVDPIAVARAVVRNASQPGTVEGGSTHHAAARPHALPVEPQELLRKAREAVLSVLIEAQLSKTADPGAIPQSHLSERRCLRRGSDVAARVRQARQGVVDRGERAHRRAGTGPGHAVAVVQP